MADEKLSNTAHPPVCSVKTSQTEDRLSQPATVAEPQHDTDLSFVTAHTCWVPGATLDASSPAGTLKIVRSPADADKQYGTVPHPGTPNQLMELASFVHQIVDVLTRKSEIGEPKNPDGFVVTLETAMVGSVMDNWQEKLEAELGSTTQTMFGPMVSCDPGSDGKVKGSGVAELCETNSVSLSSEKRCSAP